MIIIKKLYKKTNKKRNVSAKFLSKIKESVQLQKAKFLKKKQRTPLRSYLQIIDNVGGLEVYCVKHSFLLL